MVNAWLEDSIAGQLNLANTWLRKQIERRQRGEKIRTRDLAEVFEDNGSCVRIFNELHHGESLRIITQGHPLILTDGAVSIESSLSPECHKSIRCLQRGSSIAVRKYTIRQTTYGPPRDRLKFTLTIARPDGKPSREALGELKPILACEKLVETLQELRQTRAELDRLCFGMGEHNPEEVGSMASMGQGGEEADTGEGSLNTQMPHATQIVHRIQTPGKSAGKRTELPPKDAHDSAKQIELLNLLKNAQLAAHQKPYYDATNPPSAGGFTRTSTGRERNEPMKPPENRMQPTRLPPRYSAENGNVSPAPRPDSRKRQFVGEEANAKSSGSSHSQSDEDATEDTEPEWLKDTCRMNGCGKVPGTQQNVLSRLESWQNSRAGYRFPDANIPIKVLEALKSFNMNTACDTDSSDEEESAPTEEILAHGENGVTSDAEHESSPIPWSSSPARASPKRPSRPGQSLPPDSSLLSKSIKSRSGPQEASSGQEAQRVVVFESSNEETAMNPPSSPPLVPDRDDSDMEMEMEMDVPRGLGEDVSKLSVASAPRIIQPSVIVQVKETPYTKGKNVDPTSVGVALAQAQQQTSSGTSRDTSSTSIIYSTYKDRIFSGLDSTHDAEIGPSGSALLPIIGYDGHGPGSPSAIMPPSEDDLQFYPANDAPYPHTEPEICMEHAQYEPPQPLGASSPHLNGERQSAEDPTLPFAPPQPSPVSTHIAHLRGASSTGGDTAPVKRKSEVSPSKNGRRPKRRQIIKLMPSFGRTSPARDIYEELRREKEASLEKFRERTRSHSIFSYASDNDANAGAQSAQALVSQKADSKMHGSPTKLQSHPVVNAGSPMREDHTVDDEVAAGVSETKPCAQKRESRSFASVQEEPHPTVVSNNDNRHLDHDGSSSPPLAVDDIPSDIGMEIEDVDIDIGNVPDTHSSTAGVGNAGVEDAEYEDVEIHETEIDETKIDEAEIDEAEVDKIEVEHAGVENAVSGRGISSRTQTHSPRPSVAAPAPAPIAITSTHKRQSVEPASIFGKFKATYPVYKGDVRHFLGQCKQMDKLDQQDIMVPKWQWDDFIICNRTDYREYANQCLDNGEDAEPYFRFYKDNIRDTLHTRGIVGNRKTLIAAIEELEGKTPATLPATEASALELTITKEVAANSPAPKLPASKATTIKAPPTMNTPSKASAAKASIAEAPAAGTPATSATATVRPPSGQSLSGKRQSLPSAFRRTSRNPSTVPKPSVERPRPSLPAASSKSLSTGPPPSTINRPSPAKQQSRLSTPNGTSSHRPSTQRTSSGHLIVTEETGNPYFDYWNAHQRATSFTGSSRVDPDPKVKWPQNLHVRPVAEVKRKGYDVLGWKDDL